MAPMAPLLRAAAVRSAVAQNARMAPRYVQSSGTKLQQVVLQSRRASHSADAHGHEAAVEYPDENFSSAFWRNTFLALVLTFGVYKISGQYAPAAQHAAIDEEHDPEDKPIEHADESKPYLTRYLAYHMPRSGIWKERNDKHLELSYQQAEDQLLIQDAQRPKIRRVRNPGMLFDNASPHAIPVGSTIDLHDVVVKSEAKPRSSGGEEAE